MKEKFLRASIYVTIAALICCVLAVICLAVLSSSGTESGRQPVSLWKDGWLLTTEDGSTTSVQIPASGISSRKYTLSSVLPRDYEANTAVFIWSNDHEVTVRVGGESIFSYSYHPEKQINRTLAPSQYLTVPLKDSYAGKDIEISYTCLLDAGPSIEWIYIGDQTDTILYLIRKNALTLVAAIVIMVFGVIAISRYFINRKFRTNQTRGNLCKGIAMIIAAVWMIYQTDCRQFLMPNIYLVRDLNYLAQILLPIPFVLAVAFVEEKEYFRSAIIFVILTAFDDLILFALLFSGAASFRALGLMMDIPLNASVAYCAVTVTLIIRHDRQLAQKMKTTIMAMAVLAVCGAFEIAGQNGFGITGVFLPIGIIFFAAVTEAVNSANVLQTVKKDIEFNAYRRSQKTLLASVSHEIRTPINSVLGLDEMILRDTKEETTRQYAQDIRTSGKVLLALVNDILDFSRLESGAVELIPEPYSLKELLTEICVVERERAVQKGLKFFVEVNPEIPDRLVGDYSRIRQVLINLINNGVKYTPKGSVTLTCDYEPIEDGSILLKFHVKDTGIGIREEDINRIFEPFVRVDEKKNRSVEGTGLGMSITENLLILMGSRVSVESRYGKGSDFSCRIPQPVADPAPIGKFDMHALQEDDRREEKDYICPDACVLVVDDTPLNIKVFTLLLKDKKPVIHTAASGEEALEECSKCRFDVIFMDQRMPGMDGTQTLHVLREQESCAINHETPVVLLTADAFAGVREEALANGFNGYLSKPVTPADLSSALREFLPVDKVVFDGGDHAGKVSAEAPAKETVDAPAIEAAESREAGPDRVAEAAPERDEGENPLFSALSRECGLTVKEAAGSMGSEELYTSVLTDFTALGPGNADEIDRLQAAGDLENYTIKVHALKSSARLIGAMDLSARAKALEEAGDKAQEGDTEARGQIDSDTGSLLEDYRELLEKLSGVLREEGLLSEEENAQGGADGSGADSDKAEIDADSLKEAYGVMLEMADALDVDGIQSVLKSLADYRLPEGEQERVKKISSLVREVNFSGIREQLQKTSTDEGEGDE